METKVSVSIIIPTYNHLEDCLKPCVESIKKYTDLYNKEIIVVANGCTDGTQEYVKSLGSPFVLLDFKEPIGYTKATNKGLEYCSGEYIVLLNNDTILLNQEKDHWVKTLINPLKDKKVGITGPMMGYSEPADDNFLIFFCVAIKREVYEKVGFLDEIFSPGGGEDTDYCIKIRDLGYEVLQVPENKLSYNESFAVGNFPIYHEGEKTVHGLEDWNNIFNKNSGILRERYNKKWKLSNNSERAVIGKNDYIPPRECTRYKWASEKCVGNKILEIGCSSGFGTRFLKNIPKLKYLGIDKDGPVIDYAKENFLSKDINFAQCDINNFDFEKHGPFDTIICFECIEHLPNGKEIAQKLKKHCKKLLLTVPYKKPPGFWGIHHKLHNLSENDFEGFDYKWIDENGVFIDNPESHKFSLLLMEWGEKNKKTYVFCRIPKTGGTSFMEILKKSMKDNNLDIKELNHEKYIKALSEIEGSKNQLFWEWEKLKLDDIKNNIGENFNLITCHWPGYFDKNMYQEISESEPLFFTILRDPIDRLISQYNFRVSIDEIKKVNEKEKIGDFLNYCKKEKNYYTNWFSKNKEDLKEAIRTLKSIDAVGILEQFDKFINLCEKKFGISKIKNVKLNYSEKFINRNDIPKDIISEIMLENAKDCILYKYALDNFNEECMENNVEKNKDVTVVVSTKNRYFDTLPLCLTSIINQTTPPKYLIIFDDNDEKVDIRKIEIYQNIIKNLENKNIEWSVVYNSEKGQVANHQKSIELAKTDLIWRIDDDEIAESNVLENLLKNMGDGVGAIAPLVIDPKQQHLFFNENLDFSNKIENINDEPNIQWGYHQNKKLINVEHLYSSFIYRKEAAKHGYQRMLSQVGHREETIFTHEMMRSGWKLLVDTNSTIWHYRNSKGGIRDQKDISLWQYDEHIFQVKRNMWKDDLDNKELFVLDNGIGDHIVFLGILPQIIEKYKNIVLAVCYPEIFENEDVDLISIQDAKILKNGNIEQYDIYKWMINNNWKKTIQEAFKEMYL